MIDVQWSSWPAKGCCFIGLYARGAHNECTFSHERPEVT
jgi:hypothetical protein